MDRKMNRRNALKRMRAATVSVVMASSGLLSLSSCENKKKRIVLYFTGTGNCLYVAIWYTRRAFHVQNMTRRPFRTPQGPLMYET